MPIQHVGCLRLTLDVLYDLNCEAISALRQLVELKFTDTILDGGLTGYSEAETRWYKLAVTEVPPRSLWERDAVQFPRLLAEIFATQDKLDIPALAESMDLTVDTVNSLFDRARSAWEAIKACTRTAEAESISEEIARFFRDTIENKNMDAQDVPAKLARYSLMDPADFSGQISERIGDQDDEGEFTT